MSENGDELSDDEYAALLRDLEGRAAEGEKSGKKKKKSKQGSESDDAGVEDIDAFLKELDAQADTGGSTKTATRSAEDDALANEFASLEAKGELVAPPEEEEGEKKEKKKSRKEKRAEKKAEKARKKEEKSKKKSGGGVGSETEDSRGKRAAIFAAKNALWFFPAILFWWVLGAFLGQWISAGWLIAAVSTMFVFGMPALLKRLAKRGTYRPWLLGASLVLTVALIAPMPNTAGERMAHYGHWTTSAVAEAFGWAPDAGIVTAHAAFTKWLGGAVVPGEAPQWEPRQLGTVYALDMERPQAPAAIEEAGSEDVAEEDAVEEEAVEEEAVEEEAVEEEAPEVEEAPAVDESPNPEEAVE